MTLRVINQLSFGFDLLEFVQNKVSRVTFITKLYYNQIKALWYVPTKLPLLNSFIDSRAFQYHKILRWVQ